MTLTAMPFSFSTQTSTGTLDTASQIIQVSNGITTANWTASIAATSGPTALWTEGAKTFDFNDANGGGFSDGADLDTRGGQLTINATSGTVTGLSGCPTTNVTKVPAQLSCKVPPIVSPYYLLPLAPAECRFQLTGATLSQNIPAAQSSSIPGYNLGVTLSVI